MGRDGDRAAVQPRARSLHDAAEEIARGRGTQFSPAVVDAFLATVEHERPPLAATG